MNQMIGSIYGDIIGSYYETHCTKSMDFDLITSNSRFTDDTVLTVALCDTLLYNSEKVNVPDYEKRAAEYAYRYKQYYQRYPHAGYGQMFSQWANEPVLTKQKSYSNGAAMRAVPIAYAYQDIKEVQKQARLSCLYTHNHAEAINGAEAIASAVFLAKNGSTKDEISIYIEKNYRYDLSIPIDKLRENYVLDPRASYTVPPAIIAFLQFNSFDDAIRRAVSLGGDADTIAGMAGGISEAYYKVIPEYIQTSYWSKLDFGLKTTLRQFGDRFQLSNGKSESWRKWPTGKKHLYPILTLPAATARFTLAL